MKVIATASELIEKGLWEEYCKDTGVNEWAVNEGLMDSNEVIEWERGVKE